MSRTVMNWKEYRLRRAAVRAQLEVAYGIFSENPSAENYNMLAALMAEHQDLAANVKESPGNAGEPSFQPQTGQPARERASGRVSKSLWRVFAARGYRPTDSTEHNEHSG
jgi:hypothetical protein